MLQHVDDDVLKQPSVVLQLLVPGLVDSRVEFAEHNVIHVIHDLMSDEVIAITVISPRRRYTYLPVRTACGTAQRSSDP